MLNFEYKNPTKIIFGADQIPGLKNHIPHYARILMLYGGGSILKNGIYQQVKEALANHNVIEFGGIPANPEYETLLKALAVIRSEKITFLLAVGGGSVIDGTKFLSAAALYRGADPWDLLAKKLMPKKGLPFGTVLTLPGTGSEMNPRTVITRSETGENLSTLGEGLFPVFSILDPLVIRFIPQWQIANGLADSFMHVLEQYITYPTGALLQDRFAESILQTIVEVAPKILSDPGDHEAASNFMWCCTMALNDLIAQGVPSDWAIHTIGHELTAIHHIEHARTLAVVAGSYYRYNFEAKKKKLSQYATRIWNVTQGNVDERALKGIEQTEYFFRSLGIKTKLSQYTDEYCGTAELIAATFEKRKWTKLGEHKTLAPIDVSEIVKMSY